MGGDSTDIPPVKLVSLEKKVKSFMTKTGIPSDLVDAVTLPLTPVHQVLKHGDAEWVLQVPGAQEMLNVNKNTKKKLK